MGTKNAHGDPQNQSNGRCLKISFPVPHGWGRLFEHDEFMTCGTTINSEVYCRTWKKLERAILNKRCGLLSSGVVLLHDNAPSHCCKNRRGLLKFKWDVFQHPPLDMAPSDFHLFTAMKKWLGGQHFADDEELKNAVTHWLKSQAAALYAEGIGKLVKRYDKCLNNGGDYVEK
ncbi:Mariner Mos1 transposase [Araneus ventricosus]|uniref:Mariner Mos1 transposase n=1 Tax=Araneus ventricosus TaxID=182803 RepID=A0A4Y2G0P9_ARAVE|nr:Mariner Mos1 transposase [Araneus ventricosus]